MSRLTKSLLIAATLLAASYVALKEYGIYQAETRIDAAVSSFNETSQDIEFDASELCNSAALRLEYNVNTECQILGLN